eukprot:c39853_g1_i1 orf=2-163(-)
MDPNTTQQGKPDMVDKGLDKLQQSRGMDPNKNRATTEKITDSARGMLEKATGKH